MTTVSESRRKYIREQVSNNPNELRINLSFYGVEIVTGLLNDCDELQARAESAERERDKLRTALDHAESHIQEMENAEGRAFFADTAAMAKKLGDTMQERDALAERVKALESQFCPTCKHHWSLHRDICHERIGTESGIWVYCDCAERENDHA